MYDMRACFDNSWSMNEAGVTHLADMTEQTIGGAYNEITSDAANTFGDGGSLSTETDNAWANVEPGAKDINTNLTWMMDQSYNAIKAGCEAAVTSIKNDLATTGDAFEAVGKKAADTSAAISEASQKAQQSTQQNTGPSKGVTAAAGAGIGAAVGSFLGPLGAIGGAAIGGFFGSLFGHANGLKSAKFPHMANVDEQGPEMLVRKPDSGRYTYLETGDGVVPADITSKLFEMGGNRMHGSRNRCQSTVLSRLFRAAVEMLQLRLAILLSQILLAALTLWQMKSNRSYRLRLHQMQSKR